MRDELINQQRRGRGIGRDGRKGRGERKRAKGERHGDSSARGRALLGFHRRRGVGHRIFAALQASRQAGRQAEFVCAEGKGKWESE